VNKPAVAIIVPVFNEAETIERLFTTLAGQQGVTLELIICDGGSTDATLERVEQLAGNVPFPVRVVPGEKGRSRQLNAGAAVATADNLLFLHADSGFTDSQALGKGLDALSNAIARRGDELVAGHFALTFVRSRTARSLAYYFYECKARLHRPGCTHGDQGFLLRRSFFAVVGPFAETLPLLEDTRLAETVRARGEWLLLPAEIQTSARRFETEGLAPRQTLNAILMSLAATGREEFLRELPSAYQSHDQTTRLLLTPFFRKIRELIHPLTVMDRLKFWYATGEYVRANAWQIVFYLDVRQNFAAGRPVGTEETPLLAYYDRRFDRLTDNVPGKLTAVALVWTWFNLTCLVSFLREYELARP
jgi:rSAM/selenodomain-associated transferase 2